MHWGLPRRLGTLAGVIATLIWMAPAVSADPASGASSLITAPTLSLSDLGSSNTIWFDSRRDITSNSLSFPVPQGLTPATYNATLEIPVNLRFGSITVTQENRTISRLELPAKDQTPMVIPLTGAKIVGNYVTVILTITALPIDGYCWDPLAPIRFVDGSITFAGTEIAPTTIADFLPPVLRKLIIALPPDPSQPESNAAIQLAAAMTKRYSGQHLDVAVIALPDRTTTSLGPALPLERQIMIKQGPEKGLSLQGDTGVPTLLVSGQDNDLTNQTRLLADESLRIALSPRAVAGPLPEIEKLAEDTTTLKQLKQSGLNSEALWPEVGIFLDQTRFGHTLAGVRVHLIGSHTPLPPTLGGEVTAVVDGNTVGRWPVEPSGTIDHWVDIPDRLVKRSTSLRVSVHTAGQIGHCGDYLPITLTIDDSTQVQANRANPSVLPGFPSLPQTLLPHVQIGIGTNTFNDTVRAVQIVVGLQQLSGVPLQTTVTSLKQAIDSHDPAIIIAADGWPVQAITLPFNADQGQLTVSGLDTAGKPITLTLDSTVHFGSLQTVFDGQRTMLIATSDGAAAQLDELLRWLSAEPGRWFGLNGQWVISVAGNDPISIANPPNLPAQPQAASGGSNNTWIWWVAGGWMAIAAAGGLLLFWRARRS
ncbi:MAG: hypothetical protein K2Q25_06910 [Mycobacteriaceae bacterium]|nr:hypothetical protein [Mycobacteriaceae bacterium]